MVFSIILAVFVVGLLGGLGYFIGTSDRRLTAVEYKREQDYLWYTIRG